MAFGFEANGFEGFWFANLRQIAILFSFSCFSPSCNRHAHKRRTQEDLGVSFPTVNGFEGRNLIRHMNSEFFSSTLIEDENIFPFVPNSTVISIMRLHNFFNSKPELKEK